MAKGQINLFIIIHRLDLDLYIYKESPKESKDIFSSLPSLCLYLIPILFYYASHSSSAEELVTAAAAEDVAVMKVVGAEVIIGATELEETIAVDEIIAVLDEEITGAVVAELVAIDDEEADDAGEEDTAAEEDVATAATLVVKVAAPPLPDPDGPHVATAPPGAV